MFALSPLVVSAQETVNPLKVKWGNELKSPSGSYLYKIVKSGKNGITALRLKKGGMFSTSQKVIFEKYNELYDIEKSKELPLKYNSKDMELYNYIVNKKKNLTHTVTQ